MELRHRVALFISIIGVGWAVAVFIGFLSIGTFREALPPTAVFGAVPCLMLAGLAWVIGGDYQG